MFNLRTRLLISYLLLLIVTLGGIAAALIVATGARPAPPQPTFDRLAVLAQGLNLPNLLSEFGPPLRGQNDLLDEFAATREVRVLEVNLTQRTISYDSADLTPRFPLSFREDAYRAEVRRNLPPGVNLISGSFRGDGQEWLFSGLTNIGVGGETKAWLIADTRPTQSLQHVLGEFGNELALPILQASIIGLIIAVLMAVAISRTIARPLQAASAAATAVAEGNLSQSVPVTGPPEVRAVAEAFNHMSAEVLATQQAQRDFMANVSHDLKTPLTSIQGYSQAIMDGTAKQPPHAAKIIYEEADRLTRLVYELSDLARLQAGQLSMQTAMIDLGQITETVTQKLTVVAQKKGIALETEARPMPEIVGDGDRLVQALNNLIDNAIKYTSAGGQIQVKTRTNHNGVEVLVEDNGIGIPKNELSRIFERFYQVDKARGPSRGAGLGLAIARGIVEAHGGHVTVESTQGRGTTFTVWLPSAQETLASHTKAG